MADTGAFTAMISDAVAFFEELDRDNTKDWFDANRARYKAQIKAPAERFVDEMAQALTQRAGKPVAGKLFRANRDVRFSKDKRPYNTHLHMSWAAGDGGMSSPVWFFGVSLEYKTAGYGVFGFQGEGLTRYRQMVDARGDDLVAAIAAIGRPISSHGPEPLKRVPAPYDKDHPHGALLKRKGLTVDLDLAEALDAGGEPFAVTLAAFERFGPVAAIFDAYL